MLLYWQPNISLLPNTEQRPCTNTLRVPRNGVRIIEIDGKNCFPSKENRREYFTDFPRRGEETRSSHD